MATTPRTVTVDIRLRAPILDQLNGAHHVLRVELIRWGKYPQPQLTTGRVCS